MFNFDLSQDIESFLLKNPVCREFDIIRFLQEKKRLSLDVLRDPLSMFRCHFLIFNALYRLKLNALIHHRYHLKISSLDIECILYSSNVKNKTSNSLELNKHDALSHFYLDFHQLLNTSEADVNRLLDQFWKGYFNDDQKQKALKVLDLIEPVDFPTVKKQYRRLAMKHHPDRGGNADKLIAVHQAMQCLEMYY